jgi:hypothetical protein
MSNPNHDLSCVCLQCVPKRTRKNLGELEKRITNLLTRFSRDTPISIDKDNNIVVEAIDVQDEYGIQLEIRIPLYSYEERVNNV